MKLFRTIFVLIFFAFSLLWAEESNVNLPLSSYPSLDFSSYNPESMVAMLKNKELVFVDDKPGEKEQYVTAGILINATPEQVWKVITDFKSYPQFYPQTYKTEILARNGDFVDVKIVLKFKFSIISTKIKYTLRHWLKEKNRIMVWNIISGDMKINKGQWTLIPVEDGKKTIALYSVYADLKTMGGLVKFVLKREPKLELAMQVSTAILVARSTKERVENLVKAHKL